MATQWQGPHFIVIIAASGLAFAGGYMVAGRSRPPATLPAATNTSNGVAESGGFPELDTNGQTPRGRVDENELIARNAEPEDSGVAPQRGNSSSGRPPPEERRSAPPREQQDDKPPPSDSADEDPAFDPDDR
jgi:hypothetical protein